MVKNLSHSSQEWIHDRKLKGVNFFWVQESSNTQFIHTYVCIEREGEDREEKEASRYHFFFA